MAGVEGPVQNVLQTKSTGDYEDVDKMLMVVVKRRKTIPTKCMEINREISINELSRLENARVVIEESNEKEKLRKMIHGFKTIKSFNFTLDDLNEAEQKLEKYYKRNKEINCYLVSRKNF